MAAATSVALMKQRNHAKTNKKKQLASTLRILNGQTNVLFYIEIYDILQLAIIIVCVYYVNESGCVFVCLHAVCNRLK